MVASRLRRARRNRHPGRTSTSYRTVKLEADGDGHFQVDARVDGRNIDFVVDTGASTIVLRESSAAKLGIFPRPSEYTGRSSDRQRRRQDTRRCGSTGSRSTASPCMTSKPPSCRTSALGMNLLGMTFLSRVKWSHDRGRLVLEQ